MKAYKELSNGIRIIEFEPSMAQTVADMWNQSGDGWGGDMSVRTAYDVMSEVNGGAYFNVFLAEYQNEIWGYASLSKYFADDDALYLHVLNVRPDKHGQKLGKELVLRCVERTIELGFPRLDIHTWPGNTKAVPLYKKCGYMWEDRTDSTHLVNFVPTVINAEPCAAFFANADWYGDNTRLMEIKPDGEKVNEFEIFKYSWSKDDQKLIAGFERTGRRMRLLETDDYRIEMMAESHELAFGLDYNCTFEVENKSGKPLHVKINGKQDGNIHLFATIDANGLTNTNVYHLQFKVNEITEPQDIWRVHPCVLAEVEINEQTVEFGLGIETRWPVSVELEEIKRIANPGINYEAYFNITSNLRSDARVKIIMPAHAVITQFDLPTDSVDVVALGRTSLLAQATAISFGHESLVMQYEIELADKRTITYTRPIPIASRGLTAAHGFETETDYIIQNGLWQLGLNKNGAWGWTNHVYGFHGEPGFAIGQLSLPGRPFSDEFTRMKPVRTSIYQDEGDMVLEAVYISKDVLGAEYTTCYRLNAQGIFTRWHKVHNLTGQTLSCNLKDESNPSLWVHTVLPYDGGIQTIRDGLQISTWGVDVSKVDENWAFEDNTMCPCGICWPREYKLHIRWGNAIYFEHEINLPPGENFITQPVIIAHRVFPNYKVFRDFALQTYTEVPLRYIPHLEWEINSGNPFALSDTWSAQLHHRRNGRLEGEIKVSAGDYTFIENENRNFTATVQPAADAITVITTDMKLENFHRTWKKAIFSQCKKTAVTTQEDNGIYIADNGVITFKVDPRFSDACYSCEKDGQEWLTSRYPSKEPYSWFNPFIGGLNTDIKDMWETMTLRENISAAFAQETDALGNVWQGLSTTVTVSSFDKYKGIAYTQYYLTMPGLPVLCYFMRLTNHSGLYKKLDMEFNAFIGKMGENKSLTFSGKNPDGVEYSLPAGYDSWWRNLYKLLIADVSGREDRLYVYMSNIKDSSLLNMNINADIAIVGVEWPMHVRPGASGISTPVFLVLTPQKLTDDMLADLDNVYFQ